MVLPWGGAREAECRGALDRSLMVSPPSVCPRRGGATVQHNKPGGRGHRAGPCGAGRGSVSVLGCEGPHAVVASVGATVLRCGVSPKVRGGATCEGERGPSCELQATVEYI